jgi:hypothetical protein
MNRKSFPGGRVTTLSFPGSTMKACSCLRVVVCVAISHGRIIGPVALHAGDSIAFLSRENAAGGIETKECSIGGRTCRSKVLTHGRQDHLGGLNAIL